MAVYKITPERIEPLSETTFAQRGIKERGDLQRLLRANIGVVAPDVLIIAEEFGEWDQGRRRIDLLGVDDEANLVVIELKRGEDGEHMELQAIRYAAMVSGMTFARAAQAYQSMLDRAGPGRDAKDELLKHLGWEEPREDDFAKDVRIVLVSGDFSRELTTAVLWLNERDLDIRCVRMKPYSNGAETIVDVQQVVPLPEAEEYMVQVREKEQAQRAEQATRHSERRAFWTAVLPEIQRATGRFTNWTPPDGDWIATGAGVKGVRVVLRVRRSDCAADLYIDGGPGSREWNKAVFDRLASRRAEVEAAYGPGIEWFRMDERQASCLTVYPAKVGYSSAASEWATAARGLGQHAQRMFNVLRPFVETAAAAVGEKV
ncbi:MAG: DUF4268 domain-containing protein [Leptolyngbya sp. PLA1]|nr:DUF4268 domain-containing protein [Leptolyngbya sp. PLA1]